MEVGTVEVRPQRVTLTTELPGRASAFRVAEVRARVDGIVQKRLFEEGAVVKAGQSLYRIDPAPFEAALQSAEAQLATAEANATAARLLAERYGLLIKSNAVSRQEYDNAVAQEQSARAAIAGARASVRTARINLGYTRVDAPITGRTARSNITEGAYVQAGAATLLTTITQLDPVYVDTTWSALEHARVQRAMKRGELTAAGRSQVTLLFEDGREYAQRGTLQFTDVTVDATTGTLALRALVPNPDGELMPGMFVRARVEEGVVYDALLVPQRGITFDPNGRATALVVDKTGTVELRQLQLDRALGDAWLVTQGIAPGDMVIVEGLQRAKPGAKVKAVPARTEKPATPQASR
jgi:membrane fusion protein (multidrug efflux system)